MRGELSTIGIVVLPLPSVSQEIMMKRDLAIRKPFDPTGKGYRDTLIWLTFIGWVKDEVILSAPERVVLVSDDSRGLTNSRAEKRLGATHRGVTWPAFASGTI